MREGGGGGGVDNQSLILQLCLRPPRLRENLIIFLHFLSTAVGFCSGPRFLRCLWAFAEGGASWAVRASLLSSLALALYCGRKHTTPHTHTHTHNLAELDGRGRVSATKTSSRHVRLCARKYIYIYIYIYIYTYIYIHTYIHTLTLRARAGPGAQGQ